MNKRIADELFPEPLPRVETGFEKHLEVCSRCRNQPFNLCPVGAEELRKAATR